ncbi:hypothetical protein IWW38_000411 [Coemansia aciculifera]|uniref:Uncharacterized protein n=1 Tax=Coemansia aciculifera TaxID=417176 RepID=A0ACC1M8Z8_9FUNG|nr:hypothetical protein IWW38_000411 [Coemansia aciculifera]
MESVNNHQKQDATTTRSSSSSPPSTPPPAQRQKRKPANLSQIDVQCFDPDLKREALSELFDHCMTPISALPPSTLRSMSSPFGDDGSVTVRARPLSAAPPTMLWLDMAVEKQAVEVVNTGLVSPASPPSSSADLTVYGDDGYYDDEEDDDYEDETSASISVLSSSALGTFADLRRKLYGGDVHGDVVAADA